MGMEIHEPEYPEIKATKRLKEKPQEQWNPTTPTPPPAWKEQRGWGEREAVGRRGCDKEGQLNPPSWNPPPQRSPAPWGPCAAIEDLAAPVSKELVFSSPSNPPSLILRSRHPKHLRNQIEASRLNRDEENDGRRMKRRSELGLTFKALSLNLKVLLSNWTVGG